MCLVLYLGTDAPLDLPPPPAENGLVGIRESETCPAALADKKFVYEIADRFDGHWCCACIFQETILPWEVEKGYDPGDPETVRREAAYATLRDVTRLAVRSDPGALIESCWNGEENQSASIRREITISDLRPTRFLFCDDGGGTPPILLRLLLEAPDQHGSQK